MNRVTVIGRLTRDVELRSTRGGMAVCTMRLAIPRRKRAGEDQGAVFIDVVAFDAPAENCAKYLAQGSQVAVDARLEQREWKAEDGSNRSQHELIAQEVRFLDPAPQGAPTTDEEPTEPSTDASEQGDEQPQATASGGSRRSKKNDSKELAAASS